VYRRSLNPPKLIGPKVFERDRPWCGSRVDHTDGVAVLDTFWFVDTGNPGWAFSRYLPFNRGIRRSAGYRACSDGCFRSDL